MTTKFTPVFDTPVTALTKESEEKLQLMRADVIAIRKIGRMERFLGTDNYRIVKMMISTPTSIAGMILLAFFVVVALLAPVIMPPIPNVNAYMMPRDGFSPVPKPPGTVWERTPIPMPFWYTALTGKDVMTHVMGTTSEQYDILYGVVWGTRTALRPVSSLKSAY